VAQLRAAEPAPTVAPPAAKVTPAKVTPPTAKVTPPTAKVTPAPAASSAPPKVVKTPKVVVATPTPVAAPAAGGVMAQVGSESSAALADRAWSDVAHKVPGLMAGKSRKVETFSKDGKTFYRALVGGFASHADAVKFCTALKAAGGGCIVR
jgi:cell division protein FtsN